MVRTSLRFQNNKTEWIQKNRVSEFCDINTLIYSIENHLPDVENAVLSLVILYLSAGSGLTEKWYSKTHATFLKRYTTHSSFFGDLINSNGYLLNANSYRKLITVSGLVKTLIQTN